MTRQRKRTVGNTKLLYIKNWHYYDRESKTTTVSYSIFLCCKHCPPITSWDSVHTVNSSLVFSCWLLLQFTINSQLQLCLLQPPFLLQLFQSARIRHLEVTVKWNFSLHNAIDYWGFTLIELNDIGVVLHFDQTTRETKVERETVMEKHEPTTPPCRALFSTSAKVQRH